MSSEQDAEPLAIEFANTRLDRHGAPLLELLASDAALTAWLRSALGRDLDGQLRPGDLGRFLALRDAVRAVARAVSAGQPEPAAEVALLNATAAAAPSWPELAGGRRVERTDAQATEAVLAALAASAIDVFGGPQRGQVRACGRWPRCVRFFIKSHPRREYCSPHCANRARAMRHYDRHRDEGGTALEEDQDPDGEQIVAAGRSGYGRRGALGASCEVRGTGGRGRPAGFRAARRDAWKASRAIRRCSRPCRAGCFAWRRRRRGY